MQLLPDYLIDEITFPREESFKFYCKVIECISKNVILEDEDEGED